jgi:ABC-type transport system involved in multi-copper enzyme maturation permease subunit
MKHFKNIFSIAKLNASEWIRLKFFHIIIFFGVVFIAFSHLLSSLTFSVQERLLYDFGLASLEIGLIMIASLIGSHSIHREIDRKTMFVLLARPIPRSSIVLGSWGAIFILCSLFLIGFILSFILTSTDTVHYRGLLISAFTSFGKAMVVCSVAIAFGLLVRPLLALVASISYWILCYSLVDIEFFVNKLKSEELTSLLGFAKKIIPSFYDYNWKSYYYVINVPKTEEVIWTSLHSLSWICIWLLVGCVVFRRKEIV